MRSRRLLLVSALGLGCLALLGCGGGSRTPSVAVADGYRFVEPPIVVRQDIAGQASGVTVYFRTNRPLPEGSYATVDGGPPASRFLRRFVPRDNRCYRRDEAGRHAAPWLGLPLGTAADVRLQIPRDST